MTINNPYEFLGVNNNVTEEQLMDAYRKMASEIENSNLNSQAKQDKMNELNSAYDYIVNEIRGTSAYNSNQQYNNAGSSSQFFDVRERINTGRIDDAETILNGIPDNMRTAEWYYLKGTIHQRRGWLNEAYRCYQTACSIDPQNPEFRDALNSMTNNVNGGYRTSQKNSGCSSCDICSGLICADCCCECMGGDLIPCC